MSWISKMLRRFKVDALAKLQKLMKRCSAGNEVCFFVQEESRGWILEAAMLEIANRYDGEYSICHDFDHLPKTANSFYFVHYHFYLRAVGMNPWLRERNCVVWFTHPKDVDLGGEGPKEILKLATVVTMCSKWRNYLLDQGFNEDRVHAIIGGADPDMFKRHERGAGKIGFCTAYYDRKRPNRILDIVKTMPSRQFILVGRNWEKYDRFTELVAQPNFEYRVLEYSDYPAFYDEIDVFVSVSDLEGGPIPLLESMMANVVPVASDTGFAPDIIRDGTNGYLFCADGVATSDIVALIEKALVNTNDVRQSVVKYNWQRYADEHHKLLRSA